MPAMPGAALVEQRLSKLEAHLEHENPVLLETVRSFREIDRVAHRMGLMNREQSLATQIPWWPLVSVLGTFSAGKSTFINHFLGTKLQRSGNQAVDDRFTVMCYSGEQESQVLPGVALDADPRFPFYQISEDIEEVSAGEGDRIDAYLQLKTCPSERLRGKIIIDSPGFDADAQRNATLRIADHIIDLSDLVLVFFDARHPEPGAMRDTLKHLVADTISRPDSGKFLYVLNQLDTAAREDNPEDVVAAWQRALGEQGLTAGRFYTIYSPEAATPIEDEAKRKRFEAKRDQDLGDIHQRIEEVEVERAYRIVSVLDKTATDIPEHLVPTLTDSLRAWRQRTLIGDAAVFGGLIVLFLFVSISAGHWSGLSYAPPWLEAVKAVNWGLPVLATLVLMIVLMLHFGIRKLAADSLVGRLRKRMAKDAIKLDLIGAFRRSTKPWRSILSTKPAGWGRGTRQRLLKVQQDADQYVQKLNDAFTNPSGGRTSKATAGEEREA